VDRCCPPLLTDGGVDAAVLVGSAVQRRQSCNCLLRNLVLGRHRREKDEPEKGRACGIQPAGRGFLQAKRMPKLSSLGLGESQRLAEEPGLLPGLPMHPQWCMMEVAPPWRRRAASHHPGPLQTSASALPVRSGQALGCWCSRRGRAGAGSSCGWR